MSQDCNNDEDAGNSASVKASHRLLKDANEILDSLEQSHRNDLALHLYSSHLLKSLLRRANKKRGLLEVDLFIKTQIKDNWTSWPNPGTVIDPQTDSIYEDVEVTIPENRTLKAGEVSMAGLDRASELLKAEMNAVWQRSLAKSASSRGLTVDINKMEMPQFVFNGVIGRLDTFFDGLHRTMAKEKKLELSQEKNTGALKINQENGTVKNVKMNRAIRLDYRDVIQRGTQMGVDMSHVYMKTLELFSDIPYRFRKSAFKLPLAELNKYSVKKSKFKNQDASRRSVNKDFLSVEKLVRASGINPALRQTLREFHTIQTKYLLDEKMFLTVKYQRNLSGLEEDEEYNMDDCKVVLPK
ncbi:LAMI_0A05006g1_1 [Lachancea mirantina]|uniref:LAMI_0A05006g1_1 n=1 Tax=Lachancea mirantina TaxID=1230905 RepID=A0A1G4IPA7_9SACH|nr:LAMI_0A05006g1_1 [Lachancea mirantina]